MRTRRGVEHRPDADGTLVARTVDWMRRQVDDRVLLPAARVPSIRALAADRGISRFTVVEAYDRLVALGYLESRRGSGFFVREPPRSKEGSTHEPLSGAPMRAAPRIDAQWLIQNLYRDLPTHHKPGSGLPPPAWMDRDMLATEIRALGREMGRADSQSAGMLEYGTPQGFAPLRDELQRRLATFEIDAAPHQIVTTSGATQAFDLVARLYVARGDVVLVDDPAWYLMFGLFAAHGATIVGVPRLHDGPDLDALERLIVEHRPTLYVIGSVLHNPTSTTLSPAKALEVLRLTARHGIVVVEDDVYADLHPGAPRHGGSTATRLASLDRLRQVIYVGSFSKTLAANLRVGFVAADASIAGRIAEQKMLSGLATPEFGERLVCRILADGHYRKHTERLRGRFDAVRERAIRGLERVGLVVPEHPTAGLFVWARTAAMIDSNRLASRLFAEGYLLAPGTLFSPSQEPSPMLRFNVATSQNPGMLDALARAIDAGT